MTDLSPVHYGAAEPSDGPINSYENKVLLALRTAAWDLDSLFGTLSGVHLYGAANHVAVAAGVVKEERKRIRNGRPWDPAAVENTTGGKK